MEEYRTCYEGKKILVTGGAGAIGSNLSSALSRAGANIVIILDDLVDSSRDGATKTVASSIKPVNLCS